MILGFTDPRLYLSAARSCLTRVKGFEYLADALPGPC